jgi:hypothetical protein
MAEPPATPAETNWGPRSSARGEAATDSMYHTNRLANSTTPLSNSSGDVEAFGTIGGRNALNEHMTMRGPAVPRGHGSFPSQDTGYASVGGMEAESQYANRPSPLQNQVPRDAQPAKPIALNSQTPPPPPPPKKEQKKRGIFGRRLSKKN